MARQLADVMHYFLDEPAGRAPAGPPLVAVPIREKDVLRACFVWNLAVEVGRAGPRSAVLVPADGGFASARELLPEPPVGGALAPDLVVTPARDPSALAREARSLADAAGRRALSFVLVPAWWIEPGVATGGLFRWTLLFATPEAEDRAAAEELAVRVSALDPNARLGVTIHGVASLREAALAFRALAARVEPRIGRPLVSYGLLLDELLLYRDASEGRAVGLARPQSRAARALADAGELLLADARSAPGGASLP